MTPVALVQDAGRVFSAMVHVNGLGIKPAGSQMGRLKFRSGVSTTTCRYQWLYTVRPNSEIPPFLSYWRQYLETTGRLHYEKH